MYQVPTNRWLIVALLFTVDLMGETTPPSMTQNNTTNVPVNISNSNLLNITQEITTIVTAIKDMGSRAREAAAVPCQIACDLYEWIGENKLKAGGYCALAGYVFLHYRLYVLKRALVNPENWSLWNRIVPLVELLEMSQSAVADTLAREVQRRYTSIDNPNDFVTPMTSFLRDLEKERAILEDYRNLCSWLKSFCISKLCWYDEGLLTECTERLQRLAYLKSIFINWITDYKFSQNNANNVARHN